MNIVYFFALAFGATAIVWFLFRPSWMGFTGKTFWDWVALLQVPTLVGVGTFLISESIEQQERERLMEDAVQAFVDRVSALSLTEPDQIRPDAFDAVGRAQTQAVLQLVDGERAGRVLRFLAEIGLSDRFVASLEGADLSGAELKELTLAGVDLEDALLRESDMEGADLRDADLESADLRYTDLKGADLRGASLEGAQMSGADLDHADLRGANLEGAIGLNTAQLAEACVGPNTVLPPPFTIDMIDVRGCRGGAIDDD